MTLYLHHVEEPVVFPMGTATDEKTKATQARLLAASFAQTEASWRLGEQVGWDPMYRENLPEWPDRESFTWWERMMAKLRVLIRRVRR